MTKRIRQLFRDEAAVSSVVSVVLMVAIVIVLAAAVGTFVLGIADGYLTTTPQVSFETDWQANTSTDYVELTHAQGDDVEAANLAVKIGGQTAWDGGTTKNGFAVAAGGWSGTVTGGDRLRLNNSDPAAIEPGDTVLVTWSDGSTSTILGEWAI